MATKGRLVAFDDNGETIREREVAMWHIVDAGPNEDQDGLYISLSATADLNGTVSDVGLGITLTEQALAEVGFLYLPSTASYVAEYGKPIAIDEDEVAEEAPLEYVKVF